MTIRPGVFEVVKSQAPFDGWEAQADGLDGVGAYTWMAARVPAATRVLEVGCGAGNGSLALVAEGARVVAFETDRVAVRATLARLRAHRVSADAVTSLDAAVEHAADVVVVCADFADLANKAPDLSSFGALVCWNAAPRVLPFPASADARSPETTFDEVGHLHRSAFAVATRHMVPGAIVHLADRVQFRPGDGQAANEAYLQSRAVLAGPSISLVPALTAVWPYRTTESIRADAAQPPGPQALSVTALVSAVGFVN